MQTTHTPGKWHAQHWSCHAATTVGTMDAEGNFVAIAECAVPGLSTDQCIANARLIKDAPDLLAALNHFISAVEGASAQGATTVSVAEVTGWLLQARAAIAKATQASAGARRCRMNTRNLVALIAIAAATAGCSDANVASKNLSKAADMFEVNRRVVFYNGITGDYMLTIEGLCALGNQDPQRQLSLTCKTGPNAYKKHFLGLSDNVTYIVEQIDAVAASPYQYRVVFKPLAIVPDFEVRK